MDHLTLLEHAEGQLAEVIRGLRPEDLEGDTNCPPWTVRRLASHALKNQLFWAGCIADQQLMALEEAMGAVAYDGDLSPIADDVTARVLALWRAGAEGGAMTAEHVTPFGALPGSVVVDFAVIDAAAHAWDLSASVGRAIEFAPETFPAIADVVAFTCTDHTVELGLIKPPTEPPGDATDTERLMAAAGRTIAR